jgi:hypothetical protein
MAQNVALLILVKIKPYLLPLKKLAKNLGYFCNFQKPAKSKQFPFTQANNRPI